MVESGRSSINECKHYLCITAAGHVGAEDTKQVGKISKILIFYILLIRSISIRFITEYISRRS